MSDTTSKGGGQIATPLSEDDELRENKLWNAMQEIQARNSETADEVETSELLQLIKQYGIQERTALLDDLNEAGEIHHSVYDYRIEELTVLRDAGTNTRILNDKQEVEEDK